VAQGVTPSPERADVGEDPFQRQIFREQLDRVAEEKRRALAEPGPSWRDWFFHEAAKWWIGLGFLILDSWVIVECLDLGATAAIFPALVAAVYAEFLIWRCLWYEPDLSRSGRAFHRSFVRPVRFGRWTEEWAYARAHPNSAIPGEGPSPDEFL
jgi:hypothetical protein